MDGTLLDSEPSHCAAWRRAVETAGSSAAFLTEEYFSDWVGNPDVDGFCKAMIIDHGVRGTPAELAKAKLEAFVEVADAHVFPGVPEAIMSVQASGMATQLCTGSHRVATEALLVGTTYEALFPASARTTFNDVDEQKPGAAPYLRAARLAGVPPGQCVAFEDSPSGLKSATAAGCTWRLGIMTSYGEASLTAAGATHVFPDTISAIRWAVDMAGAGA